MKIFHLGYLLLLDSLDMPDDEFGTRSARLLAQMRDQGYETSLDLVSRKGDPRYQPLVLPALRHLDYLVINELEAGEFSGLRCVTKTTPRTLPISRTPRRSCWRPAYASGW
jgi:sugar/nucleoside kinase (ribokinase family)